MEKTSTLEQFELLVLTAVASLEDAYGPTIHAKVEELKGKKVTFGPVYSALNRLENKGYVRSMTGVGGPQRAGRPKRNYTIEPSGVKALKDSTQTAERVAGALQPLWGTLDGIANTTEQD